MAAISYDSRETLSRFAAAHRIGYPLLSDEGSKVIRAFGILNSNIPPDHRFYGIPFPGDYLIAPGGTVRDKVFLPDYQIRPTASELLLKDFGVPAGKSGVKISADELTAEVTLSSDHTFTGHQLGVAVDFALKPGWHIYGEPLPGNYTVTSVAFDQDLVAQQSFDFPPPKPVELKALGERLPVYEGSFRVFGTLLIKSRLEPGEHKLQGVVRYQACSDEVCRLPQAVRFELPLKIELGVAPAG